MKSNLPFLLDLNVLIALAWPSHIHHGPAHRWFATAQISGWATCPITQSGFIRLSSNPKILPEAVSPKEALQLLKLITRLPKHLFWADSIAFVDTVIFIGSNIIGYRQIIDAYLLSLAIQNKGCLVTFDKGIATLVPASYQDSLKILK